MSKERNFLFHTNHNILSNFAGVKFGINRPILETELNEMQKIQEDARSSLIRQLVPTGFLDLKRRDFLGEKIIFNPNNDDNSIAFAPADLIVNGYEVKLEGKDKINNIPGYTIVDLGNAPYSATQYYDFVFLEVWFEELSFQSNIYKHGHVDGELIKNSMVDSRVEEETSRRVGMRYKIRVEKGVNLDKWESGFGYNNSGDYSRIYASGPKNNSIENLDYLFLSATSDVFKGLPFHSDNGLFVAGRPKGSNIRTDFNILDDYIFAVPLFAIKRRNQKTYSIDEPNGAPKFYNSYTVSERPDGLFHNRIVSRDLKDLRKLISFEQWNTSNMLDTSLKKLLTGELQTKSKETVERIQFGVQPLTTLEQDDMGTPSLYVPFNKTAVANYGPVPSIDPSTETDKYDLGATGYGVLMDGDYSVKYRPVNLLNWVNKNEGTVEFFIKPFWDGADEEVSQTIFEITDDLGNSIIALKKKATNLILEQKYDALGSDVMNTIVDLTKQNIYYNGIYHIRVTWDRNVNKTSIYINGNESATGWFLLSALNPTTVRIGKQEQIKSYSSQKTGCIIDEFAVYNKVLDPNKFYQLEKDVVNGNAKIYQSFNGSFRSFKDNSHIQSDIITGVATVAGNTLVLEAPHNAIIGSLNTPVIYNKTNGQEYDGSWSGLNTNAATFTLSGATTPNGTALFNGEIVWIKHDIIVSNGNGVDNLPVKILKAEMNGKEISYTKVNEPKREVKLINPDLTIEMSHKAWDYNSIRGPKDAFARVIQYKFESNGTFKYTLPKNLYGYEVMGIKFVDRPVRSLYKDLNGDFVIELEQVVVYDDYFTAEIALAGFTFDYESYSKSIVSNMMKAQTIKMLGTGNDDTLVIPVSKDLDPNGGIIVSFLGLTNYKVNPSTGKQDLVDLGEVVYYDGMLTKPVTISGIGTPFITIKFDFVPRLNSVIEIPILTTYQPVRSDKLSVWYEYIPYQGILSDKPLDLKRITDWKIFSTTLGSGNVINKNLKENSINNASNRLPGGQKFAYLLKGDNVEFEGEKFTSNNNLEVNRKIVFRRDYNDQIDLNYLDDYFNSLNTEFTIVKKYGNHQDSKIDSNLLKTSFYINDTKTAINKYMGAACLTTDDLGNILLFVIGEIKKEPTMSSVVEPIHGDVFRLENSPIVLTRRS